MSQSSKTSGTNFEVLHGDAQGSTVTVTDGSGKLVSHSLYDAWGQQSVLQVGSTNQLFVQSLQRRGYTGHENVEGLGIIHMNGRIYDPLLARFVQADPTLQFPQYSQGYNRYAYVLNNPMTYTDPSGYFIKNIFKALAKVPLLDQIVTVAVSIFAISTGQVWMISVYQGLKTYALTGSLGAGLRAFATSELTMFATAGISEFIGANVTNLGLNVMAHSAVGGVMSVVQGGKFGHGFISSMVSASMKMFMEPQTGTFADAVKRTTIASIVGGTVSAITGGKFANGAITSAMQWWYNAEGNHVSDIYEAFGIGGEQALDSPLADDAPITSQPQKSRAFSGGKAHTGTDYGVPVDTPVMATADGVVISVDQNHRHYGKTILIQHKNGIYTRYAHGNKLDLQPGAVVSKGQVIMLSGNSGRSTNAHLHYEVIKTPRLPSGNGHWGPKLEYSSYYRANQLNGLLK